MGSAGVRSLKVTAALNHAAATFQTFRAADWLAMSEECRRQAEQVTCVDCGADMGIPMIPPDPSVEWEIVQRTHVVLTAPPKRTLVSSAKCRRCGFETAPYADATIEEHMKECPKKPVHRRVGDRWSCRP